MKIKKGDSVEVVVGADRRGKGESPVPRKVLRLVDGGAKVVVEGVNRVYKHVRRGHPKSPQGGRLSLEMPIDISNVLLFCDRCGRGVRVGTKLTADGSKIRVGRGKKCGHELGVVSGPNPKRAAKK